MPNLVALGLMVSNKKIFKDFKNQRTTGPESRTDGETLIFWD